MDFRIRQLQCFLTLADLLNYGKTARAMFMSQPTTTFQIKSLEQALGVKLFERDRQQVRLTEAGYAFREYAQSIVDTVQAAKECLSGQHTQLKLRVSCGPVGQFVLLPAVIRALAAEYPEFKLEVSELTTEQQISRLQERKVDAVLMVGAFPVSGVRFDPICKESLLAVVPRQSRLASQRSLSIQDFRHTGIIAIRPKDCWFQQQFLHSLLAPYGITPRMVEAPHSSSVQFAYVAAGEGVAITTSSMAACRFPGVVMLPFKETLPEVQLGLCAIEANEAVALTIFRKVVMQCADAIFARRTLESEAPIRIPTGAVTFSESREAI